MTRAKKGRGTWLLDILQMFSDFDQFDHTDLQRKYSKYEQAANENKTKDNHKTII